MKLYYKSRKRYFNQNEGQYTLEYLREKQRPDYSDVKINSFIVPLERYSTPKFLVEIDVPDEKVEAIKYDLENFYKPLFNLAELTPEQAKQFIRDYTDLQEDENGFIIGVNKNNENVYLVIG